MARPKKIGLPYFPLDCQMDDKVEMLEAEHGMVGFAAYIKLLQHIYQTENGELDMAIILRWKTIGKQMGITVESLRELVDTMLEVQLFDRAAFTERQVLTSNGVQKRITKVTALREKDRFRKADSDSDGKPEFSAGKPVEKGGKGKGKGKGNRVLNSSESGADAPSPAEENSESNSLSEAAAGQRAKRAARRRRPAPPAPPALETRWPELVAQLSPAEQATWAKFVAWEKKNPLPKVFSMVEPLLPGQFIRLAESYPQTAVAEVLLAMQNKPDLHKRGDSANLTIRKWLKIEGVLPLPEKTHTEAVAA